MGCEAITHEASSEGYGVLLQGSTVAGNKVAPYGMVFSAEWKRPSGSVAVTPRHKYVHSLLCKYGVDVEVAGDRACACKKHISSQEVAC
jgi:hypothetical protein